MTRLGRIPTKVSVTNIGAVPAKYFLRPRVIAAVQKEVIKDLNAGLQRTPGGVNILWKTPGKLRVLWIHFIEVIKSAAKVVAWKSTK